MTEALGLGQARGILARGLELLDAGDTIAEWWSGFEIELAGFIQGVPLEMNQIVGFRQGLDQVKADSEDGDRVLAAMKMALSAFVVAGANPYSVLLEERPLHHNDLDPLVRKAVGLIAEASQAEAIDGSVSFDPAATERVEEINSKRYVLDLIQNAVRPGDGGD